MVELVQELRDRLGKAGCDDEDLLESVIRLMRPYWAINGAHQVYPLRTGAELRRTDVASALAELFGLDVAPKLICYSVSRPFEAPPWMTREAYCRINGIQYEPSSEAPYRPGDTHFLRTCLEATLGERLWAITSSRVWEHEAGPLSVRAWDNITQGPTWVRSLIMTTLTVAIAYLLDRGPQSAALLRLMELQTNGWLALGQKKREDNEPPDAPENWIIVCA